MAEGSENDEETQVDPTTSTTDQHPKNDALSSVVCAFGEELKNEYGLDICHPFHPIWYNDLLCEEGLDGKLTRLPIRQIHRNTTTQGEEQNDVVTSILIGNTKHMWPFFVKWYKNQITRKEIQEPNEQVKDTCTSKSYCETKGVDPLLDDGNDSKSNHPLDTYVQECIENVVSKYFVRSKLYWSCSYDDDDMISMQRIALVSGLSYHDNKTMLCVHPIYGTWHSFRACVIVFSDRCNNNCNCNSCHTSNHEINGNNNSVAGNNEYANPSLITYSTPPAVPPSPPQRVPCLLSDAEKERARIAMENAINVTTMQQNSNNNDTNNNNGLFLLLHRSCYTTSDEIDPITKAWIELRDCVEIGCNEYRFGYNQLMYHYTRDQKYIQYDE